jgi:trimethylamine---corrinoid protein Co-methyltransferase
MVEKRINPTQSLIDFKILSQRDIFRIYEAALEIMEDTGVKFPSKKALKILADHGCEVDYESKIAKIPNNLVEETLKTAPKEFLLAARDPSADIWLDRNTSYLSTDGGGIDVYDINTGERRRSRKQDIIDACKVADYLPEISYIWGPPVTALDVPEIIRPLHELEASMLGSSKHIQPETVVSEKMANYALEMASMVVGGKKELAERPIFSFMQCALDPLGHDSGSLEASMVAAEWGIPTGFMPMPMSCATAPTTVAGNLVVTVIDMLSPLVLMQLVNPGTPTFFAAAPTAIDLRTGAYTGGGPEDHLLAAGISEISNFLNIPMFMGAYATGAKEPDWQSAMDNTLAGLMPVLTKAAVMNGAGTLNGSKTFSLQQLIMDTEIYRVIKKVTEGIEVNEETLAVNIIKEVGPSGDYLTHEHTLKHMYDIYQTRLLDRSTYETWLKNGKKGAYEKATEMAKDILATHEVKPIDSDILDEWKKFINSAQKELSK